MQNPMKAKMPMTQSKIMNSQPTKAAEMVGGKSLLSMGSSSEAQVSSWSGKQVSAVGSLAPMQTNTIIS